MRSFDPRDVYGKPEKGADALIDQAQNSVRFTRVAPRVSVQGVYFIGACGADMVKIGTIVDIGTIEGRLSRLQTGCPYPLMLLFIISPAGRREESKMHRWFAAEHFRGEWYRYRGELKEFLTLSQREPQQALRRALDRCAA